MTDNFEFQFTVRKGEVYKSHSSISDAALPFYPVILSNIPKFKKEPVSGRCIDNAADNLPESEIDNKSRAAATQTLMVTFICGRSRPWPGHADKWNGTSPLFDFISHIRMKVTMINKYLLW